MNPYLTRDELADWLCCGQYSYRTMGRRLEALGVPHVAISGFPPRVLRSVHDALMSGDRPATVRRRSTEPNFDAIRERGNKRKVGKPQ